MSRLPISFCLLSTLAILACGSTSVIDDGTGGDAASSSSSSSSMSSSSSGGAGGAGTGGMGGGGSTMKQWDNSCTTGFISIDTGMGAATVLNTSCPNDWGAMYHDGPTAYTASGGGVVDDLGWVACLDHDTPRLWLSSLYTTTGTATLTDGKYLDGTSVWSLTSGSMTFTQEGMVGEMLEGSYVATLESSSATIQVTGSFSVCHIPEMPAI